MNYLNSCMFLSGSKSYILNCPQSSNCRNGNYMCENLNKMNFVYFDWFLSIISSRTDGWRWCHLLEHLSFCRCRFFVAVSLFSNRSQEMSKYGKNISDMLSYVPCATYWTYHALTSSVIYCWTDARKHGNYFTFIWSQVLDGHILKSLNKTIHCLPA